MLLKVKEILNSILRTSFKSAYKMAHTYFVISASESLDMVDLHWVGRPDWYHQGPAKAAIVPATT